MRLPFGILPAPQTRECISVRVKRETHCTQYHGAPRVCPASQCAGRKGECEAGAHAKGPYPTPSHSPGPRDGVLSAMSTLPSGGSAPRHTLSTGTHMRGKSGTPRTLLGAQVGMAPPSQQLPGGGGLIATVAGGGGFQNCGRHRTTPNSGEKMTHDRNVAKTQHIGGPVDRTN